jgi:hypothetical protein
MGWTVQGLNPRGGKSFHTHPDRPQGPPSLLHNQHRFPFLGVKCPGCGTDHSPPSSNEVVLYLYLPSVVSWHVMAQFTFCYSMWWSCSAVGNNKRNAPILSLSFQLLLDLHSSHFPKSLTPHSPTQCHFTLMYYSELSTYVFPVTARANWIWTHSFNMRSGMKNNHL